MTPRPPRRWSRNQLAGKTPGQVAALIARAVVQVDPDGAAKRREQAQREQARVRSWHEHAGTAALACKAAGMAGTMDQLRRRGRDQ